MKMKLYDTTPLVSVLLPCYNHASYVIATLESIAANDYPNIELIFIDDASQDDSYNLAQEWILANERRFVRTVQKRHEENRGICSTVNELLNLAKGVFVNYTASDDLILPNGISRQVSFATEKKVDFLFTDSQLMDKSGRLITESALAYFGKSKAKLSENSICLTVDIVLNWQWPWNKFFANTNALKSIGGFDPSLLFEDRDVAIRILNYGSYAFLPESVWAYRYTGQTTAGLSQEGMFRDFARADIKNYYNSSGLIRVLLFLLIFTYVEKYQQGNYFRNLVNLATLSLFRFAHRIIRKAHNILLSNTWYHFA